jgi:asparagine synthetase B (glutamine-hydrolysing)
MNFLLAAQGVPPEQIDAWRGGLASASSSLVELAPAENGTWLAMAVEDAHLAGSAAEGPWRAAAFGTGVSSSNRTGEHVAEALRRIAENGPVTAPEDTVLVAVEPSSGSLVAAVGAGWHRLFVAHPARGGTVVSTSLGLLAKLLGDEVAPDRSYEDFLLGFGFLPDDRTVHRGIAVLHPGVHHWGGPARNTAAEIAQPEGDAVEVPSFDAAADELHDRFMEVVEELAGPHRSVAVMLGGFDSALVAAALARLGREVTTFTFGFGDKYYEQRNVDLVTQTARSTERWVQITPEVIIQGLLEFGRTFAQPGPQPHYQIHTLHASREIRAEGFDMVLTGDGCDAIFLGYPMVNTRARLMARLGRIPHPLVDLAHAASSTRMADRHLGHVGRMARSTLGNLRLPMPERGHLPTRYLDDVALARLRAEPAPEQTESVTEIRHRLALGVAGLDPVRLAFHGNAATGQSRVKVDGSVAATGLRQYSPFLHPRLKSFVTGLPVEYLRPPGSAAGSAGKAVLIEMIRRHRLLPDQVVDMPKQSPVAAPIDHWYTGELKAEVLSLLEHLPFEWNREFIADVLRPKFAERQYRERVALGHHTYQVIGLLASYASFHRR